MPAARVAEERSVAALEDVLPNSIAVLPFGNLSPDPDNAYFAAGIHESTLNQLGKISGLIVIASTSVMQYAIDPPPIPEIAKALNVEAVMVCSVRYANGRVLITPQLIDGRTGRQLWSDEFDRELADVFAVQSEVAQQIAIALQVALLPEERARIERRPTDSAEAYEHYLYALSLPYPIYAPQYASDYVGSLKKAIEADPNFADAYGMLAEAYYNFGDRDAVPDTALRAIELDPSSGFAYAVLGLYYGNYHDRLSEAKRAYEQAIELSPNNATVLVRSGRQLAEVSGEHADAIRLGERAAAIDPTSDFVHWRLGFSYLRAGQLEQATRHLEEAIEINPMFDNAYLDLAIAEYLKGDKAAARRRLDRAVAVKDPSGTFRADYIPYLYGLLDDLGQAKVQLNRVEELLGERGLLGTGRLAWGVLGVRDKERALSEWTTVIDGYLNEGLPVAPSRLGSFRDNWLNDPMLEEPEFRELRRRLGFKG
jgi:TolB-like protein/Flp pilus assembly protein TadD